MSSRARSSAVPLILAAAGVCLLIRGGLPAQSSARLDRVGDLLARARKAISEDRGAEAIPLLREARRLAPKDTGIAELLVAANHGLACRCLDADELTRAEDFARAALEVSPARFECLLLLARILDERRRPVETEELYRAALRANPRSVAAHTLFARFLRRAERLAESKEQMEKALLLDPSSSRNRAILEVLDRDLDVESGFESRRSAHFDLRYNPAVESFGLLVAEVLATLELAHAEIARDLGFAPEDPVTVLFYTEGEFAAVNRMGHWVTGFFDGRIRVGIRSWRDRREEATRTLRHEVTHAFLAHEAPACPTWVQEGLAQIAEGTPVGPTRARVRSSKTAALTARELRTMHVMESPESARRFYDQCHLFMDHLLGTRGRPAVIAAVRSMRPDTAGAPPDEDAILREHLGGTLEELLDAWLRSEELASPGR